MSDIVFVLDANVFIEAARRYYAFDLVPVFWDSLIYHAKNGRIQSIDRVKTELERGKDELAKWIKGEFVGAFASTNEEDVIKTYSQIMTWVQAQNQFSAAAKTVFAQGADGWLIAFAKVNGCKVITHEVPRPDVIKKVPIPNVCQKFRVTWDDTFGMLRALEVQFT